MSDKPSFGAEKLRPHQLEPARHLQEILRRHQSAVDGSGTGTGKTYTGAFVAKSFGLPTLVVGPKVSKSPWFRAAEHFDDRFSFCNYELLRTGNTPFGQWDKHVKSVRYFRCQCCQLVVDLNKFEPCPAHAKGIHCLETHKRPSQYGNFHFHPAVKFLIFDESHRCNGMDSLNAELMLAAKRQKIKTLALSATLAQSPKDMRALGYLLDLHNDKKEVEAIRNGQLISQPSFSQWMSRYQCRWDQRFRGYKWFASKAEQSLIMRQIRDSIIPSRGVRVRSEDIPGFPKRVILPELYELDAPEKIDGCYGRMKEALDKLSITKRDDKNPEHPLTLILRARQEVELLKIPIVQELEEDDSAKGFSIVFFVNFAQTIEELRKLYPDAGVIDGSPEGVRNRDRTVDLFQANELRRLIVNCQAGEVSLSLHDLHGDFPRMGYFFPNFSAVSAQQVFGRFQRDGGKSTCYYRVIFANKTVEMPVHRALMSKLDAMGALMDGALADDDFRPVDLRFKLEKLKS